MKASIMLTACLFGLGTTVHAETKVAPAPNGIELPAGYKNWRVIASSHRQDNKTLRVVLGNDKAIDAARAGDTNPWPDGSILGKLVWKDGAHDKWAQATVPAKFVHAEFMIKDSDKYADTGGWGFARWKGLEQTPHGEDASFVMECYNCHMPVKDNDYVFTHPASMP